MAEAARVPSRSSARGHQSKQRISHGNHQHGSCEAQIVFGTVVRRLRDKRLHLLPLERVAHDWSISLRRAKEQATVWWLLLGHSEPGLRSFGYCHTGSLRFSKC